jgi:hypothetical protein
VSVSTSQLNPGEAPFPLKELSSPPTECPAAELHVSTGCDTCDNATAATNVATVAMSHVAEGGEEPESFDLRPEFAAALQCGRLVACIACQYFESRPNERPDGWCRQFKTETWGKVSFRCPGYVERRQ